MKRIIINPDVFNDKRDALAVAWNEAFRVVMEDNEFVPQCEPTEEQRRFFADTAYANDETMLRRTIVARIATFDTSVENPTPDQVRETIEFLNTVLEIGAPQNDQEVETVQRIIATLQRMLGENEGAPSEEPAEPTVADAVAEANSGEPPADVVEDVPETADAAPIQEVGEGQVPEGLA